MAALPIGAWAGAEHSFAGLNTSYVTPDEGITVGGTTYSYSGDGTKWFGISVNQDDLHVKFELKRNGSATFSLGANYMTVSAAPCRITISGLTVGQSFKLSVASNNSGALTLSATEGCTADAGNPESAAFGIFGDFKYTATATTAIITTADAGTRLKSITLDNVETVTITSAKYATFANNTNGSLALPSGLKAYGVSGFSASSVTFAEYNVIPAGAGVILKANTAGDYTLFETETACTYNGNNFLVPVTAAKVVPATEYTNAQSISAIQNYIFANKSEGVGFYKSSGSGEISAGKAYLSIPNPAQTTRTWDFITDGWSNTTIANLETERKMATGYSATSAGTTVEGELWIYSAHKQSGDNYNYRYINTSAVSNAELYANNSKISETQGLLFNAGSASRLGIDNRDNKQIYLFNENVTITIPGLIKGSTVAITSRVGNANQAGSMTCTDATNVTRTGADASTSAIVNSFTINKSALSYTFAPSRVMNVHKIVVTPPATVAGAREFLGFDGLESETTAIEQIETQTIVNDDSWYTLQGVRIAQPSKGIYIHNGKKVFIK